MRRRLLPLLVTHLLVLSMLGIEAATAGAQSTTSTSTSSTTTKPSTSSTSTSSTSTSSTTSTTRPPQGLGLGLGLGLGPLQVDAGLGVRLGGPDADLQAQLRLQVNLGLCDLRVPTIGGTAGDDVLTGTPGNDVISGGNGSDTIDGGGGDDVICGGYGDDTINGGDGNDRLFGEEGNDLVMGDGGDDIIEGSNGQDDLEGGAGADTISGGGGDDSIGGDDGNDTVRGDGGDDRIFGGDGDDTLEGANGPDLLNGGDGRDSLDGGSAADVCIFGETVTSCERDENAVLPEFPTTLALSPEGPGTVRFEGGPGLEGLVVEVDSDGGLSSGQIRVRPDRQASFGIAPVAVSPAYDISVPDPGAVRSATITLPYDPARLRGTPESHLRIATFNEGGQLWIPVAAPTTVDTVAKTVTVGVTHFSLYAVVEHAYPFDFWDAEGIRALFGTMPVNCVAAGSGSGVGLDVVFTIDSSGSMSGNDPSALRVAAAKTFLTKLRPGDRAAVVDFDSSARTLVGLTDVAQSVDRQRVAGALDATANASGGTNLTAAVSQTTSILETNGGGGRVRVGLLLTDGESTYDDNETARAAAAGVTIYTVALGPGADTNLLQRIATGTGGTAFTIDQADELAAVYEQLARDIIDDGTDSDGDGLTDCEERNGLFTPVNVFLPGLGINSPLDDYATFTFPKPDTDQSDGDGTSDGVEVRRANFADNPDFARAFQVLVDAGRSTYFIQVYGQPDDTDTDNDGLPDPTAPALTEFCPSANPGPSPFAYDSDDDDLSDAVECVNGTNPLRPNVGAYGIDGLPPFTLFTPDEYFDDFREPIVPVYVKVQGSEIQTYLANRDPVYYDDEYNCVRNCAALTQYAVETKDDNGRFGICIAGRGDCVTDAGQIRDKVRDVVEQQGVFDGDGDLRTEYIGALATVTCLHSFRTSGRCGLDGMRDAARSEARNLRAPEADRGKTDTLRRRLGDRVRQIDPAALARIVNVLELTSKLYRDAGRTPQDRRQSIERAVRACVATRILDLLPYIGERHPCEVFPIFLPGKGDAGAAAQQTFDAIAGDPTSMVLVYSSEAERNPIVRAKLLADGKAPGTPRRWYEQYGLCDGIQRPAQECDEYPYYSSNRGGPPPRSVDPIGTHTEAVPGNENRAEGNAYSSFTRTCPSVGADRRPFVVVPLLDPRAPTDYVCSR